MQRSKRPTLTAPAIPKHVTHSSGRRKTVCTATCLEHWGVPPNRFHYCQNTNDMKRILRNHGCIVRSRLSSPPRSKLRSVGALRSWIRTNAPEHAEYLVRVPGHVLVLDDKGDTIVDTAPQRRDHRQVIGLWLVYNPALAIRRIRRERTLVS